MASPPAAAAAVPPSPVVGRPFVSTSSKTTESSASCNRCVNVLREILSGLNTINNNNNNNNNNNRHRIHQQSKEESPPLTLIKAIARHQQQHSKNNRNNEQAAQHWEATSVSMSSSTLPDAAASVTSTSKASSSSTNNNNNKNNDNFEIENTEDGIRISLPVTATLPNLLRRWSSLGHKDVTTTTTNTLATTDSSAAVIVNNNNKKNSTTYPLTDESTSSSTSTSTSSSMTPPAVGGIQHALAISPSESSTLVVSEQGSSTIDKEPEKLTIEVKCRTCSTSGPEGGARAFLMGPTPLSIVLCSNRIHGTKHEIEEILTHEFVHLYDVQTLQLDLQQCENLAYSEVRAAKAAECRDTWSQYMKSYCVKQKAICATNNLFPSEGRKCIQTVFQKAFDDNRPFSS